MKPKKKEDGFSVLCTVIVLIAFLVFGIQSCSDAEMKQREEREGQLIEEYKSEHGIDLLIDRMFDPEDLEDYTEEEFREYYAKLFEYALSLRD